MALILSNDTHRDEYAQFSFDPRNGDLKCTHTHAPTTTIDVMSLINAQPNSSLNSTNFGMYSNLKGDFYASI